MATPAEISEAATCFSCIEGKWPAMLYLLNQIRVEQGGAAMTAAEIAEASTCFSCIEGKESAMLYLLEQIVAGGGGGGGTQRVFYGSFGDPNGNVTADGDAVYYDDDGGVWGHYSAGNNDTGWSEIIS